MPLLLIDCESGDGSWSWFKNLSQTYQFDMIRMPLRPHGLTLDEIFRLSRDDALLLVDSDLEIVEGDFIADIQSHLDCKNAYGAGFIHVEQQNEQVGRKPAWLYKERMWIPFCALKVPMIQPAIIDGESFHYRRHYLEVPFSSAISKLAFQRNKLGPLNPVPFHLTRRWRKTVFDTHALFLHYDTGAKVHQAMTETGRYLADLGKNHRDKSLRHYHGITRVKFGQGNTADFLSANEEVTKKLADEYGVDASATH